MSKGNRQKKGGKRKGKRLEAMRDNESLRHAESGPGYKTTHRESEKGHTQKFVAPKPAGTKPS